MALSNISRLLERFRDLPDVDASGIPAQGSSSQERPTAGSVGGPDMDALTLLLGRGSARRPSAGGQVLDTPYKRLVRPAAEGGGLLEGHDYGEGNVKWFRRKNQSALQQAAQAITAQRGGGLQMGGGTRAPGGDAALEAQLAQLDPEQRRQVAYLLGR